MLGQILSGILGGLGGLGGGSKKQSENFSRETWNDSNANMQDLSPEMLKMLEGLFSQELGSGKFEGATGAMSSRLQQLLARSQEPGFDVNSFVKGITDQAIAAAGLQQESDLNGMLGSLGASEGGNSMSALMGNKIRNNTMANVAGASAQATATGEGIRLAGEQQLTEGIAGLGTGLSQQILGLIQNTRGANTTATGKTYEKSQGTGTVKSSESNPFGFLSGFMDALGNAKKNA